MAELSALAKELLAKLQELANVGQDVKKLAELQKSLDHRELLKELDVACDRVRKASYPVVYAARDLLKATDRVIVNNCTEAVSLDQEALEDLRSALTNAQAAASDVSKEVIDMLLALLLELDQRSPQRVLDAAGKIADWGLTVIGDFIPWSGTVKKVIDSVVPGFSEKTIEDLMEPVLQETCLELLRRGLFQISIALALGKFAFATYCLVVKQR